MTRNVADDPEHLEKLREIRERWKVHRDQKITDAEVQQALGYYGFFTQLKEYLDFKVNNEILHATRDKLNLRQYAQVRDQEEKKLIQEENWKSHFGDVTVNFPSNEDIEAVHNMDISDILTYLKIVTEALKRLIDNNEENTPLAQKLHEYYLLLKTALEPHFEQLKGRDGFLEYIETRDERLAEEQTLSTARTLGNVCIYCHGTNIHSKGDEWVCWDCRDRHRKDKNVPYRFSKHSA